MVQNSPPAEACEWSVWIPAQPVGVTPGLQVANHIDQQEGFALPEVA